MENTSYICNVPVLLIIFNRQDTTERVLESLRKVQPKEIYIAADGPRNAEERETCDKIRAFVLESINWPTKINTLFRDKNLGCRLAVSQGISWFFSHVEKGIILEDDCLPSLSFFKFCEELLVKYQFNDRIMHIGGANNQDGVVYGSDSYYFSRIAHIWGWASWRRAWLNYDLEMQNLLPFIVSGKINNVFSSNSARLNFIRILVQIKFSKNPSTWDYQWAYSVIIKDGVSIVPNYNLISNIGFGINSTHAQNADSKFANIKLEEINVLSHPETIEFCKGADDYEGRTVFQFPDINTIVSKAIQKLKK